MSARSCLILIVCFRLLIMPAWGAPQENAPEQASTPETQSQPEAPRADKPTSWSTRSLDWLINQRNNWSHRLVATGRSIDGFLANRDSKDAPNHSHLKLSWTSVWKKSEVIENTPKARFKLDLPLTNERFRLVIENEPTDETAASTKLRDSNLTDKERPGTRTEGRLSFGELIHHWKWRGELGVKAEFPPDPFVRIKAARKWNWPHDGGETHFQSTLFYTHIEHLGFKNALTMDKPLKERWLGRSYTDASWDDDDHSWTFVQSFSAFFTWDERRLIENRVAWIGENKPSLRSTDYLYQFRYRQKLYQDWLFLQVVPEALWSRDKNWDLSPSLSVGLELVFSE
ncbi:hypothetical protein AAIA72_06140 [Hahella sp. SMD15-11]|uniref:DUF3187 family protein n=1 Tax=Thermohahella caldifontis TaxID=3142973 RepID=A0AB39V018_9GAMM